MENEIAGTGRYRGCICVYLASQYVHLLTES